MFGYVRPGLESLDEAQKKRYPTDQPRYGAVINPYKYQ